MGRMLVVIINLMERDGINFQSCFETPGNDTNYVGSNPNELCRNKKLVSYFEDFLNYQNSLSILKNGATIHVYLDLSYQIGMLSDAACKKGVISDSLGRILRKLVLLAECYNLTIESCLEQAWSDIRDRKGMMVDGVFVKEADLT